MRAVRRYVGGTSVRGYVGRRPSLYRRTFVPPYHRSPGFTLIEVLVALVLSSLVVLLAHRIFLSLTDGAQSLRASREALDRTMNRERWLRQLFLSLTVGSGSSGFMGHVNQVRFTSWVPVADGWNERQQVNLTVSDSGLVAMMDERERIVLDPDARRVAFDYLLETGANTRWVAAWESPVSAPLAVRVRTTRPDSTAPHGFVTDTVLYLIGERG